MRFNNLSPQKAALQNTVRQNVALAVSFGLSVHHGESRIPKGDDITH
ncbi:hypothetical protein GMES_3883 [Paraglaciecola mesophila KMM 241]|uniref:Uncharacterized protein n=1 Tax=Paraglaciecola mesophila KMM 241 TaxID=1128912 RepID=K6YQ78_9ALTE|nr:hypothetical protein GMES_3883 [Paraglaciecola mesophila KMM 241]